MMPITCFIDKLIDDRSYDRVIELYNKKIVKMSKIPNSFLTGVTYALYKQVVLIKYTNKY
jgi:hypothetical protein